MRHGHGSKTDEVEGDTERFFRGVDRGIAQHHSKPSGLPLILAALPEYHTLFRSVTHNPRLVASGIEGNAEALSNDALREAAWQVMQPVYVERLQQLVERFGTARAAGSGDDRLPQVPVAAVAGRVDTLLIEGERRVPGRIDPHTGAVETAQDLARPDTDDLLDDFAERVLECGGEVVSCPQRACPQPPG